MSKFSPFGSYVSASPLTTRIVAILRAIFICFLIFILNGITDLGTSPWVLSCAAVAGVFLSTLLLTSRITSLGFLSLMIFVVTLVYLGFNLTDSTLRPVINGSFSVFTAREHCQLFALIFALSACSTWFFWKHRAAVTLESLLLCCTVLYLMSGHRNFHLDRPRVLNSAAWILGVQQLSIFVLVGSALLIATLAYLYTSSFSLAPSSRDTNGVIEQRAAKTNILSLTVWALLALMLLGISAAVYRFFEPQLGTLLSNGVGSTSKEGMSPLGFHSALGSTNQPAALVRLEGDYEQNPFSPMLYMRESALSGFNGHEMIFAGKAYDDDLPGITPNESFTGKEKPELQSRVPLVQSIYPLVDNENAFAVDYPVSIVQLKNPNTTRFKSAYRAYSIAPAYQISQLEDAQVGDPHWSPEIKAHYLEQNPDKRYADLAEEITKDAEHPIQKMLAITNYLSRTSIYTLTPNHDVDPTADPVAPYLFGDHRGYCVHFAHAIVYMARALGIPARIGTGYLTDLSQAKDGHILLRMSDRHAWSEVYITDVGWVPFDIQPDQVESHAETQVDSKLLEELMGMLDPGEEILPKDIVKDEANVEEPPKFTLPEFSTVLYPILALLIFLVGSKLYLLFGWKLPGSAKSELVRSHRAVSAFMTDLGYPREIGETRSTYSNRMHEILSLSLKDLTNLVLRTKYGDPSATISRESVRSSREAAFTSISKTAWWRKLIAFINPQSIITWISGGRW